MSINKNKNNELYKFVILVNSTDIDEIALYDVVENKVIIKGDKIVNNIELKINSFLEGLDYMSCKYIMLKSTIIESTDELFEKVGFTNFKGCE